MLDQTQIAPTVIVPEPEGDELTRSGMNPVEVRMPPIFFPRDHNRIMANGIFNRLDEIQNLLGGLSERLDHRDRTLTVCLVLLTLSLYLAMVLVITKST